MRNLFSYILSILLLASCNQKVFLFTSFHEPATEGLRLLYSKDAYHWKDLNTIFLKPMVDEKVMRDPSMIQGPDGTFHLVFTSAWHGKKGFGYASSKDLIHWSEERIIDVMKQEPTTVNVWAPELFYDDIEDEFIIIWASTIPYRFTKGIEEEENNHRMYYTITKDFKTFTDAQLFFDPGFSVIDAVIVKQAVGSYQLLLKDNTRPERNIRVASSTSPLGPWMNVSKPFTDKFTEGPSPIKVKDGWLIYFDSYQKKTYDAVLTKDFKAFTQVSTFISVPAGHKHGTILKVSKKIVNSVAAISNR